MLSDQHVDEFLAASAPLTRDALTSMSAVETWTVDDHTAEGGAAGSRLLEALETKLAQVLDAGNTPDATVFLQLVAYIKSPRFGAALRWVEGRSAGYTVLLSQEAANNVETNEAAYLFMDRLSHLEKSHVLWNVFSPERIAEVLELLDTYTHDAH